MGALTFLKKLGQILVEGAAVATGLYPLIQPLLGSGKATTVAPTIVNDLQAVAQVVVEVETAFNNVPNSTGAQKLQASIPLINNIISTSALVAGKKIANQDLYTKAIQEYAQATVDLLNAIHPDEAKHAS